MAVTPNLQLPLQSNWTTATVDDWAKAINDEAAATNAFQKIDSFAGTITQQVGAKEATSNKVTSISSSSTDTQYPSAKCVYDLLISVMNTPI